MRRDRLWQDLDTPDEQFHWYLPERFNISRACVDDQPPDDLALIVDDGDGEVLQYPRRIHFVDQLPMTTTGKIQRAELRRRAAE